MIVGGEVEDFGLGDGALLVRSHHLRGSEEDAREIGHLGPRHAIRGKRTCGAGRHAAQAFKVPLGSGAGVHIV